MDKETIFDVLRRELQNLFIEQLCDNSFRYDFEKRYLSALVDEDINKIITLIDEFNKKFPNSAVAQKVKKIITSATRSAMASEKIKDNTKYIEVSNEVYRNFELDNDVIKKVIQTEDNIDFDTCRKASLDIIEDWGKKTGNAIFPFIISHNKTLTGRVIQSDSNKQTQILMSVVEKKTGGYNVRFINDQSHPLSSDKFELPMYKYQFASNSEVNNSYNVYTVISKEHLPMEEIRIDGFEIPIRDEMSVGNKGKVEINTKLIFAINYTKVIKTLTREEFNVLIDKYRTHDELYKLYYSILRQPEMFEKFLMSMMFCSKGTEGFPSHIGLFGPAGCGKSKLLETVVGRFGEMRVLETTTVKGLVPNFGGNTADPGYFIKSKRWCCVDEFLNMIIKADKLEEMRLFNSLLTHAKGISASGKHKDGISASPTATMWFVSNFVKGRVDNFIDLCNKLDVPFLSRFILYTYPDYHVEYIRNREDEVFTYLQRLGIEKGRNVTISELLEEYNTEAITIADYLKSINSIYDHKRVSEIFKEVKEILPEEYKVRELYDGRGKKHIVSILDGVTKYNHILENREGAFTSTEKDYEDAKDIWYMIVSSWTTSPLKLPIKYRERILTEDEMAVYLYIKSNPGVSLTAIEKGTKLYPHTKVNTLIDYKLVIKNSIGSTNTYQSWDYLDVKPIDL